MTEMRHQQPAVSGTGPHSDRVRILCERDRQMLEEFSRRSLKRLKPGTKLSIVLTFLSSYLDGNVKKEVEKDRLIIEESAAACEAGRPACDLDLEHIFEKTKKIDKAFLDKLIVPSFTISVHYADFADVRIQRIWRIARSVYDVLSEWPETASFTDAIRKAYTGEEFKQILSEILHLYNLETRTLGESIRSPFHSAITAYCEALYKAMEEATEDLAETCSRKLFGDKTVHA